MATPQAFDVPFRMYKDGASPNVVEGTNDVLSRSLSTIIQTLPGERVYRPTFGCWARAIIFSNMTEGAAVQAASEIRRAVAAWEQRVEIRDILFDLSGATIFVSIEWRANGNDIDSTTVIEFAG